jgi:hypothetical protein
MVGFYLPLPPLPEEIPPPIPEEEEEKPPARYFRFHFRCRALPVSTQCSSFDYDLEMNFNEQIRKLPRPGTCYSQVS